MTGREKSQEEKDFYGVQRIFIRPLSLSPFYREFGRLTQTTYGAYVGTWQCTVLERLQKREKEREREREREREGGREKERERSGRSLSNFIPFFSFPQVLLLLLLLLLLPSSSLAVCDLGCGCGWVVLHSSCLLLKKGHFYTAKPGGRTCH
jgi:hypothetical protein